MATTVFSEPELLKTENKRHLREVLTECKYPTWALDRMEHSNFQQSKSNTISNNKGASNGTLDIFVIPYT